MKIAIPHFSGRISPVFDVAKHFYLIEIKNGREIFRSRITIPGGDIFDKCRVLSEYDVDVVICGAISQVLNNALRSSGIRLVPYICGELEEVLQAFISGTLAVGAFQMPGCCGKRRRRCHGNHGGKYNPN